MSINKTNILITGVGGPTPRSFARAVKLIGGDKGMNYRFVGVDCNPLAYGLYDHELFDTTYLVPNASDSNYWNEISRIIEAENIHGAIVLPENEVLEWCRNHSKLTNDIKTHLPDFNLAKGLINKHRMHTLLQDTDFIPSFTKVDPQKINYQDIAEKVGTPFWIRSTEGSSGLGSLKISSKGELNQWLSINKDVKEFIATEFLPGRNLACKMLYFNGQLIRTACAERVNYIMANVAPSGITGNTSYGKLVNEPRLHYLSEVALDYISSELNTSLNGIFTVDFKEDENGQPKITEINIRHVAFTASMAAGGANIPLDTLDIMFSDEYQIWSRIDYNYPDNLIFLRDVDDKPKLLKEQDLMMGITQTARINVKDPGYISVVIFLISAFTI